MVLNSVFALGGGDKVERSDECDCRRLVMGRGKLKRSRTANETRFDTLIPAFVRNHDSLIP